MFTSSCLCFDNLEQLHFLLEGKWLHWNSFPHFFSHRCFFLVCSFIVSPNQAWLCSYLSQYSLALSTITDITPCNVLTFTKVHYKTHVVQTACIEMSFSQGKVLNVLPFTMCPSAQIWSLNSAEAEWRPSNSTLTRTSGFFFKGNFKEHQTR